MTESVIYLALIGALFIGAAWLGDYLGRRKK